MPDTIKQEFQSGGLPPQFVEEYQILPENRQEVQNGTAYLTQVMEKVLGSRYDASAYPIRIVISESDEPQIFSVGYAQPALIGVTTAMLKQLQTEDQLAAGLARAAVPLLLDNKLGFRPQLKPEEMVADIMPVVMLQQAGFRPDAVVDLLKIIPDTPVAQPLSAYLTSTQVNTAMRRRLAENAEVAQRRATGIAITESTPLNQDALSGLQEIHTERYVINQLAEADFVDAMPDQKLSILAELIETQNLAFSSHRIADFRRALESIRVYRDDDAEVDSFNRIVNRILAPANGLNKEQRTALYRAAHTAWDGQAITLEPLGNLAALHQGAGDFAYATSREMAEDAISRMERAAQQVDLSLMKDVIDDLSWVGFTLPSRDKLAVAGAEFELPWKSHAGWIQEAIQAGEPTNIARGLRRMGVDRTGQSDVSDLLLSLRYQARPFLAPKIEGGALHGNAYDWKQLRVDDNFRIIELREGVDLTKAPSKEALLASEETRLAETTERGRVAMHSADWDQLRTDFWGFVKEHAEHLTPQKSVIDSPAEHFAAVFTGRLSELIEEDPATFGPLAHEFFTGTRPLTSWIETRAPRDSLPNFSG